MNFDFKNKLVLITGACTPVALESAKLFANTGANLALVDNTSNLKEISSKLQSIYPNLKLSHHISNLGCQKDVTNLFIEIKEFHNMQPNVLVTIPEVLDSKSFLETTESDYEAMININLKGTFLVTQLFLELLKRNFPLMKFESTKESYASIVHVVGVAGKFGERFVSHYGLIRSQIEVFSKTVARENGCFRIRSNVVWSSVIGHKSESLHPSTIALKRYGKPEEVANLVLFLASDRSSFITGTCIDIDGG